jgi:4-hydroxy-tetrahydrodipicolinate reductase
VDFFLLTRIFSGMLNVIVIGLGPIGINVARAVLEDPGMKLAGLVDVDPAKLGKTLDELEGIAAARGKGPKVVSSIERMRTARPDLAIVTTTSFLNLMAPTLRECIKRRIHVVSSCEEMSYPWFRHRRLANAIDADAKRRKVALLGTGVNPGFVMDLLPAVLSSMVTKVTAVRVTRRLDAGQRRKPLQAKVGATMTPEHFRSLAGQGKIGHMGIGESVAMLAAALGQNAKPQAVRITLEPVLALRELDSLLGPIAPGMVCGMRNTATWSGKNLVIDLDLTMAIGADDPQDNIAISGPVPLKAIIPGSTHGDTATVAAMINCARMLPDVSPGLKTMLDMPPASCRRG